ncbi:hypothetical protein FBU59_004687 [Linderina macrospora]|uniref:Uncharacterized protein n=1 Tax=Linderina macrospora TaxID=4868 RepID=A0ACC1J516_9FUNG|nr:hypothetical protein FBU59_004687 [Linderina macrospora]
MLSRILPRHNTFTSATGSLYEDEELANARKMLDRAYKSTMSDNPDQLASLDEAARILDTADRFEFPHINIRHSFPKNASIADIQKYSQDKSWLLTQCLREFWAGQSQQLLGEFQLSFLIIFVGQNFAGFEHWKRLLHLVLGSNEALADQSVVADLITPVLRVFGRQLADCPQSFVTEVLESDNFVARILNTLVLNVYESEEANAILVEEIDRLRRFLKDRFGWTLMEGSELQELADVEEGEYAPVVVDL